MESEHELRYQPCRDFTGRATECMPKLISQGRVPMSVSQIMQKRLEFSSNLGTYLDVSFPWKDYSGIEACVSTGDAGIVHPNGDLKIVLDSSHLREISKRSRLNHGGLIIDEETYDALPARVFSKLDRLKFNFALSKEDVKKNPIWIYLARGDMELLNDYTDFIFSGNKYRPSPKSAMGIYCPSIKSEYSLSNKKPSPELRSFSLANVLYDSNLSCWNSLDEKYSRLMGIFPEEIKKMGEYSSSGKKEFTNEHHEGIVKRLSKFFHH